MAQNVVQCSLPRFQDLKDTADRLTWVLSKWEFSSDELADLGWDDTLLDRLKGLASKLETATL